MWFNINHEENDLRQPLFGLFALPLAVIATAVSKLCFFFRRGYEYYVVMQIIQFLLYFVETIKNTDFYQPWTRSPPILIQILGDIVKIQNFY